MVICHPGNVFCLFGLGCLDNNKWLCMYLSLNGHMMISKYHNISNKMIKSV